MAAVGNTVMTLGDWAKYLDPSGNTIDQVDLLAQTNEMIDDALWKEANGPTSERISQVTGLPDVYYRLLNVGVPSSKSTSIQIDEPLALLEGRSQVDEVLLRLNGNGPAIRMMENERFFEAMSKKLSTTLLYGSSSSPEEFVGLANRYNSLSGNISQNVISAGSVTGSDATSVYLMGWGYRSVYMTFAKGLKAGLEHQDLGVQDAFDSNNYRFRAWMDLYRWNVGLALKDWRFCVRICNIDASVVAADTTGGTINLINLMIKALHRLPSYTGKADSNGNYMGIKPVFYCNRTVRTALDIQAQNKSNLALTCGEEEGRLKTSLRGIPIKTMDAIVNTESTVS